MLRYTFCMKYVELDKLGKASKIILGCDHYGETISEDVAYKQLDIYLEHGGNVLDTARLYGQSYDEGPSSSELLLGRYLKHVDRSSIILATKCGHPCLLDKSRHRLDNKSLTNDILKSIDELNTTPDILFLHRDCPSLPVDEIMETLHSFVAKGYTKAIGASNWSTSRIDEANKYAIDNSLTPFTFSELQFSLAYTDKETWGDSTLEIMNTKEQLLWYERTGMPYFAFSSQGKGVFSKVLDGKESELSDRARQRFLTPINIKRIERVKTVSEKLGVRPSEIVLSYITSQKGNGFAIIGSSKIEQIKDSLSGTDLVLDEETLKYLDLRSTEWNI